MTKNWLVIRKESMNINTLIAISQFIMDWFLGQAGVPSWFSCMLEFLKVLDCRIQNEQSDNQLYILYAYYILTVKAIIYYLLKD